MQELSLIEVDQISGGIERLYSSWFGAVSGGLWCAAEIAAIVPGGQPAAAFLGLGAGMSAGAATIAFVTGN
jgi:hypothetical protein